MHSGCGIFASTNGESLGYRFMGLRPPWATNSPSGMCIRSHGTVANAMEPVDMFRAQ